MAQNSGMKIHEERYMKGRALVRSLKTRYFRNFSATDRNITGLAFGRRTAHGETTDDPALVVYVVKKSPKRIIPPSLLLPRRMYVGGDCVEVDVVETGPLYALSFTANERPATLGISVGHINVTAGTLGGFVTDNTDGASCILSNNHVLADSNVGLVGDAIVQSGVFDGGTAPTDTIATLRRFVMLNATGNTVDGAIGLITGNVINQVHANIIPTATADHPAVGLLFAGGCNITIMNPIANVLAQLNITLPGGAGNTATADIGMNVEKVGRTTEYTTSTVKEIDATVTVGGYGFGSAEFDNQFTTAWMSDGGDSGSLVYRGGTGGDEDKCNCGSSSAGENVLGVSLKAERCMADVVRDKFLRQTKIGKFAVDAFFVNEERLLERFDQTKIDPEDRDYARKLYDKYSQEARAAFVEGEGSERRLTEQHLRDARSALKRAEKYMSAEERHAAEKLFALVNEHGKGKNAREILALLNDEKLHKQVQEIAAEVKSLRLSEDKCR